MVVGWYHSHPGFGCWLSGVDINTQQSFEALSERAVAVVVDPIQSVKGKVKMCDCWKALYCVVLFMCFLHFDAMNPGGISNLVSITWVHVLLLFSPGCYRCLQTDQRQHDGAGSRAKTNHIQPGPSEQALDPGKK